MRQHLGRYRITGTLGEGGMGVVYAAVDDRLERPVAIKTLREADGDPAGRARLEREARAVARVNHPNICQLYELGEDNGELFLAMELLQGEALASRLAGGPMAAAEAVTVALGMLAGLAALHRESIVHRDLKPSNIFLTPHGVKLLDFGLAFSTAPVDHAIARLTAAGMLMGTPLYAAPEQLRNDVLDSRTDLYAATVVLYEMLSGRAPFSGRNLADTVHAIAYEPPPPLAGVASAALDRVMRIGLAKRQADRYPDADTMARDLRAAMPVPDTELIPALARPLTRLIVLPLRVLRPDAETDFLAFSLADAITNGLSGLQSLVVRSSGAALRFAGSASDLRTIAAEAEVDAVLTGTLLRGGDELRVATQLVEVPAGAVLWSHTTQVPIADVFSVQDQLTSRILESLSIPLTARERRMLKKDVPASPRAYEMYLRANELGSDTQQWHAALELYEQCVAGDPEYAPAWAGLGRVHRMIGKYVADTTHEHFGRAEHALKRALDLNPDLSMAENVYAQLEVDLGRSEAAMVRLVRRARERPSDPELFAGLTYAARYCGLLQASVAASEHATRLDPSIVTSAAHTFYLRGDYDRALASAADPYIRSLALIAVGREGDAAGVLECIDRSVARHMVTYATALLQMIREQQTESARTIRQVARFPDPEGRYHVARHLARLGETDEALSFLDAAVREGFVCVPAFVRDPWLDSLRASPAFAAIMRDAHTRHRRAIVSFISAEGDRVLGIEYPV